MNTTDNKIEILTGMVQSLVNKIEKLEANQLPQHQWLSSKELSVVIGVTDRTVQNWRKDGKFPKPVRLSPRAVAWREREILEWIESCELGD